MTSEQPEEPNPAAGKGFLLAMLATIILAFAYLTYGPGLDHGYVGFGALLAIPFAMGALATAFGYPFSRVGCIFAPVILFALIFPLVYYGFAEGLVCILMVLPFWLAGGLGGGLAYLIYAKSRAANQGEAHESRVKASTLLTLPFALIFAEEVSPPEWQERTVIRSVTIEASAAEVWPLLLAVPDIGEHEGESTFTHDFIGVPRPSGAKLIETDAQLVRKARWGTTIQFEEHIHTLVPRKKIAWNFVFPDDSVQAHTDQHIDPNGPVLRITRGGYGMYQTAEDTVRLELSTSYRMRTRLDWYFGWWGERLLGDVHANVLEIIKQRAEAS
uniref:hypothetical protein n=1 Tax=uncultured Altererythrobacter sp. TaxID=500840 RepID=UPI0026393D93|nr:hypothetical protein [uncultured Altererythrobacter sp.]